MTRILLLAHDPLASALKSVAAHAFPDCAADLVALDVAPTATLDSLEDELRRRLAEPGDDWLVLVDAFGATPCNAALRAADGVRARVVSGVNVPMLWRALCYRSEGLDALVERATTGAVQGVMQISAPRRQNQSSLVDTAAHDQVDHHHQQ